MAIEIISNIQTRMEWISEIASGIKEYSEFINGVNKEIPHHIKTTLCGSYQLTLLGYSTELEEEAKELCKTAIVIMKRRLRILIKKNIEDLGVLDLMTAETDEEKEEVYNENII